MPARHKITDELTKSQQDKLLLELLEGRPFWNAAKELAISDNSVRRWFKAMPEEEKRRVLAQKRVKAIEADTEVINQERMDISTTYESLARRVEKLITKAEQKDDDSFALAAMEGLRKVLHDIAQLQGKLATNLTVQVSLAQSAEWLAMRRILQEVIEEVPEARAPLLRRMRARIQSVRGDDIGL